MNAHDCYAQNARRWPLEMEPKRHSDLFRSKRRLVMNRSYFDAILMSFVVAGCYLFIAPV
ncbi:hypothetical protein ASC90_10090 [Rhizobium sp. Root1220]|nr:hypothetical protein ASC90_10090 [Rhizobium sp. Root1220]